MKGCLDHSSKDLKSNAGTKQPQSASSVSCADWKYCHLLSWLSSEQCLVCGNQPARSHLQARMRPHCMYTAACGFICLTPIKSAYTGRDAGLFFFFAMLVLCSAVICVLVMATCLIFRYSPTWLDGLPWMRMIAVAVSFLLLCMVSI